MMKQVIVLSVICFALPCLTACASAPKEGDIQHSTEFRSHLERLITDGAVRVNTARVTLDTYQLTDWIVRSLTITPAMYEKDLGLPTDSFGIDCKYNMNTPITYTRFDTKKRRLTESLIALHSGTCAELKRAKVSVLVAVYSFEQPFSTQVPQSENPARIAKALKSFTISSFKQTDSQVWELKGVFVGESAGYTYHDVPGIIPHSTLFEKKDNNYYRLVL